MDNTLYYPVTNLDYKFLADMMFLAIFVPDDQPPVHRSVLTYPEISRYIQNWGREHDAAIVAEHNKTRIGLIWARTYQPPDTGYGYINPQTPEIAMAILPEYRNKGIGTQLLKSLLQHYTDLGIGNVSLSVDKRNRAVQFYKQNGFSIVSENENDFIMICQTHS